MTLKAPRRGRFIQRLCGYRREELTKWWQGSKKRWIKKRRYGEPRERQV